MRHYSLRLSDEDYDYFCAIARAESLTLSASIRRHMNNGGMKLGLRAHHSLSHGGSNVSTVPISALSKRPVNAVVTPPAPVSPALLDAMFDAYEDEETARLAEERRIFEEGVEPPDEDA